MIIRRWIGISSARDSNQHAMAVVLSLRTVRQVFIICGRPVLQALPPSQLLLHDI